MSPELLILVLNSFIVLITYQVIYPRFAGRNINKLVINDLIAVVLSISIAAYLYQGTRIEFDMLLLDVNWFWFSLSTYLLIETPFALRYIKRYRLFEPND